MLTPAQQEALRSDIHLSVTANAGSGKTRVLVERYLRLVTSGEAGVANVVAITFTEKAASELRRKVADGLQALLAGVLDPPARRRIEAVRDELPSAVIHTIHGFCSRLLREFPVEAGVDAAFSVIEPVDNAVLIEESLQAAFRSVLREGADPDLQAALTRTVRLFGRETVRRAALALASRREILERMEESGGVLSRSDAEILAAWQGAVEEHFLGGLEREQTALAEILASARGASAAEAGDLLRRACASGPAGERIAAAAGLLGILLTGKGTLATVVTGRGAPDRPGLHALEKRLRSLRDLGALLEGAAPAAAHADLLHAVRTLLRVHRLVRARCDEVKRERALLDYDDLQLLARRLLRREPVRSRLAARYRYIMVDEYQDTNRLQYELLRPLVDDLRSGNLFIVGDPKQSIYGFRNAEVEVFRETQKDIVRASGPSASVVLGESFRPLPAVAGFVNLLFSSVLGGADGPGEVAYDPIVQARPGDEPGSVEILVADAGGEGHGPLLARRIRRLLADTGGATAYGDIAVLVRTRKLLPAIEEALLREDIPYLVSGGTGYFQTQDVYDFVNYVRFLLDPGDEPALVGVLRSPFFAVSDAELYEAVRGRRGTGLWEHLTSGAAHHAPALARAVALLTEHRSCAHRLPAPDLLERIVADTGYEAVTAALPRGEQSRANLRKLEEFVRRFDARGFTTLYDLVRRLRRLVAEEDREGQGAIDLSRDAVQLMTVHAAKGLEFPVVIVPGLERSFLADSGVFLDEELGVAFRPAKELGDPAPIERVLAHRRRARSQAEERRIFYVACTRARDMLILSGTDEGSPEAVTWWGWLHQAMGWQSPPGSGPVERTVGLREYRMEGGETRVEERRSPLVLRVLRAADLPAAGEAPPEAGLAEEMQVDIGDVVPPERREVFSATQLRTYEECPARYYLRYVLGIEPPGEEGAAAEEPGRPDALRAKERGTLVHALLQRVDGDGDLRGLARELVLAAGVAAESASEEAEGLVQTVDMVRSSSFWREVQSGTDARTEYAVTAPLGSDYLTGTFDRLYRDAEGIITVLDFKTDAVAEGEVEERAAAYRLQMDVYMLLAARVTGSERVRGVLLFTRRPESPVRLEHGPGERGGVERRLLELMRRINSFDFKPLEDPCSRCEWLLQGCPVR